MRKIGSMKRIPELALPAGSLQCALYAFKGGADAVYLGLKDFSARKSAVNFSFEDLRKLKAYCVQNNKKFYITLNTLLTDNDIPLLMSHLKKLEYIRPDGIIVQDLGVAKIIRDYFPSLELHASTQLAVHNTEGVRVLAKLGFTRVVLARELSFEEIKEIREACPDIEIKVFIHGAMCYGFSGLCMASEKLTGRSANCGACAQICRTWFSNKESRSDSFCFSMKDMCIGKLVEEYARIGIDSLKVEGRMKGSEYVYHTARYYRDILDGKAENLQEKDAMQASFSRCTTEGFFYQKKAGSMESEKMICDNWPGHIGFQVGTIKKVGKNSALINFSKPVSVRDGLLVISNGESAGFALNDIQGKKTFVGYNETVTINFPSNEFKTLPPTGTPVYCTSRHNQTLSLINENVPMFKAPVDIAILLEDQQIMINGHTFDCELQNAKTQMNLEDKFREIFSASDKSFFTLNNLTIENRSSFENPFIPLSVLKDIRRNFYAELDTEFENSTPQIDFQKCSINVVEKDKDFTVLNPLDFCKQQIPENSNHIVLNNIGQILFAQTHPDLNYYAGPFLYTKNSFAYQLLCESIPNFKGIVSVPEKEIPLFISRVCYRHNALGKPCKGCSRNNSYSISQNGRNYTVICKNCITTVLEN